MFLFEQSFSITQFTGKESPESGDGEKTAYIEYRRHQVRPGRRNAAAVVKGAGPSQKSHIAQTGKSRRKECATIKQQNGSVHYSEIVEKGEWAREISSEPNDTGNQDDIEIDLEMRKETKIMDIRQDES